MNKFLVLLLSSFCLSAGALPAQDNAVLNLHGSWSFQLDTNKTGEKDKWYTKHLTSQIPLPGTTDENGFGTPTSKADVTRLTRQHTFYGPAWYQRMIDIPASWSGRHVELFLERVMWESKVWVDDQLVGSEESLCVPHKFNLTELLSPGKHRITIRVDNRYRYNIGAATSGRMGSTMWTMAVTDESQTTWNGIIGRIELRSTDPLWIERYEAYPDIHKKQTRVLVIIRNDADVVCDGEIKVSASGNDRSIQPVTVKFKTKGENSPVLEGQHAVLLSQVAGSFYDQASETRVEIILPFGDEVKLWDEFSPERYTIKLELTANHNGEIYQNEKTGILGFREFIADGKYFRLNGRKMFLRGNQDNCIHPLTGYPPMDVKYWITFLGKYKQYGLNHVRFHSWCPPEEAFIAGDELGMILQIEAPMWDGYGYVGHFADRAAFIRYESERILNEYGNHPSFCMFSIGNELGDGTEFYLQYLVEVLRARDNRHLYTCASAPASTLRNDDYLVGANGVTGDWACSLSETCFRGLKQWKGNNGGDVRDKIETMNRPLIAHEIGQHTSFPDFYSWFNEKKYTGPLKAGYINIFKKEFEKNHSQELGRAFAKASGELQLLLYKAEIEIMLRTPNLSGFHLNGISDYPGEGVALIGILDAFMDSKGIASPERFRQFCSETVPLARLPKQTWSAGELFEVQTDVRHHGPVTLENTTWRWKIIDRNNKLIRDGIFNTHHIPTGELSSLGVISLELPRLSRSQEMTLEVSMDKSKISNTWRFWVYADASVKDIAEDAGVVIADEWNEAVKDALRLGKKVLLFPSKQSVTKAVEANFFPVFWSKSAGSKSAGALGIFCNPSHPSLSGFPTRSHADWQWYDLLTNSFAINIENLPFEYQPVVHLIDFFKDNNRLALLTEATVGKGKLMICTLNVGHETTRSQVQHQMIRSLVKYVKSKTFRPAGLLSIEQLDDIL